MFNPSLLSKPVSTTPFFQPILSIAQVPDVWDIVERNAHGNVQLGGGHVDPGDGFGHGVFHLETWVQLQEAKGVSLGAVEILHGASTCSVVQRNTGLWRWLWWFWLAGVVVGVGIYWHHKSQVEMEGWESIKHDDGYGPVPQLNPKGGQTHHFELKNQNKVNKI